MCYSFFSNLQHETKKCREKKNILMNNKYILKTPRYANIKRNDFKLVTN